MASPTAEIEVDAALIEELLAEQHPDLCALPIVEMASGWDNAIFRLGDELLVRLPRRHASASLVLHEQRWLPELGPVLPLPVPMPLRIGVPGCGFPWGWTITALLPGDVAERNRPRDWPAAARRLGEFQAALHRPAPADAPRNPYRWVALSERSELLSAGLDAIGEEVDTRRIEVLWEHLVDTPAWHGPPLWLHGDMHPLNLLVHNGALSAVIDFGDMTAGDPATDLSVAWMLLPHEARWAFRKAAGAGFEVDDHTWARAQGWALALAISYLGGDERISGIGRRTLDAVLSDVPDRD